MSQILGFPKAVITAKKISSKLPKELGFVNRAALIESYNRKELLTLGVKAFCHFHLRRDLQLTIYEIGVHPQFQGQGFGRKMMETMVDKAKKLNATSIVLKCPQDLKSNKFYKHFGFKLSRIEQGRKRKLNVWTLSV